MLNSLPFLELINWPYFIGALVFPFVVGFIWYAPKVFGDKWMELTNTKDASPEKMKNAMAIELIANTLMAFVLLQFMNSFGVYSVKGAFILGFILWLGFVIREHLSRKAWEQTSWTLLLINGGASLIMICGVSVILFLGR